MPKAFGAVPPSFIESECRALDRVLAFAEFDRAGSLLNANANYRKLWGIAADDVLGSVHRANCAAGQHTGQERELWADLRRGRSVVERIERVRHDGVISRFEQLHTPVLDVHGRISQVYTVAWDAGHSASERLAERSMLQQLGMVADATHAAVMICDANGKIAFLNREFTRLLGWQLSEVAAAAPYSVLALDRELEIAEACETCLRLGQVFESEGIVSSRRGERFWVRLSVHPVVGADARLLHAVFTLTDITQAKMHEVLLHRGLEAMVQERSLTEVLQQVCVEVERIAPGVAASILRLDEAGKLHPLVGPSLPEAYSMALDGLAIGPCVGSCGTAAWRNEPVLVEDMLNDPLWAPFRELAEPLGYRGCWSTPIRNSQGQVTGTFALYFRRQRDAAETAFHMSLIETCTHLCALALERETARQRIHQLALYDGLTGLPNRSLLQATADQALATVERKGESLAVLFIDLDRFKHVNDSLGRPAGDELLRQVGARLRGELRACDVVGRLSSDEFVVVTPASVEQATDTIQRLQKLLAEPMNLAGSSLTVTASVGAAMFPSDGRDIEILLQRADIAMDQAKERGRGQYSFYDPDMNQAAQERLALENALRQAVARNQLRLHYQPQVCLRSGQLYGVEALARWSHAILGEISPGRFIPLAEDCGLVADIGRWALREACRQLALWRAQGLAVPSMSVNLSPTSFHHPELPGVIAAALQANGLQPQDLTLEVTENVLLDTHPRTMKTIAEVHALGVKLSMDDFGTGYSSLSALRRLPFSELKLDRSFVADLESDEAARALSSAILGIGNSLGLTVIAEGVETAAQTERLNQQGYPVVQGYLISRPRPPELMGEWLREALLRPQPWSLRPREVVSDGV